MTAFDSTKVMNFSIRLLRLSLSSSRYVVLSDVGSQFCLIEMAKLFSFWHFCEDSLNENWPQLRVREFS
jgi:hypothetical protein